MTEGQPILGTWSERASDWEVLLSGIWQKMGVVEVQVLDLLEQSAETKITATFRGSDYEFDITAMTQTNLTTGRKREMRRTGRERSFSRTQTEKLVDPVQVTLHVYHVGHSEGMFSIKTANGLLSIVGSGAYHAAIQVYDLEWSYGEIEEGTGVFWCQPGECPMHDYKQAVPMGTVTYSKEKVDEILDELKHDWQGKDYDLLRRNCCHFSDEFLHRLGANPLPPWVLNLAGVGAKLEDYAKKGGKMRYGSQFDLRCNSYHFGDVTRGIMATGAEIRGAEITRSRYDDILRGLGTICCSKEKAAGCILQ